MEETRHALLKSARVVAPNPVDPVVALLMTS
ncbi:unannotated protein [freshwater metagenome]|uniref:Unannotated protein n=1 Tax=freshwater metagenome TaxID=449393 RepID=A0A6J7RV41_9ZZZZ